jgi:hypothetical protein
VRDDALTAGVGELLHRFTDPDSRFGPLPIWWLVERREDHP